MKNEKEMTGKEWAEANKQATYDKWEARRKRWAQWKKEQKNR